MDIKKVYLATRHNSGLKLPAIFAARFAKLCKDWKYPQQPPKINTNYSNVKQIFSRQPTEYKEGKAWGKPFESKGYTLRCLEDCENNESIRFVGFAHELFNRLPTGYYCDNDQHEVFKAGVWQLSSINGCVRYLAGYIEPWNDSAIIDCSSILIAVDSESQEYALDQAARSADRMADTFAEECRDLQTIDEANQRRRDCLDEISQNRQHHSALIREYKQIHLNASSTPSLYRLVKHTLKSLRFDVNNLKKERQNLQDQPWTINEC